MEAGEALTLSTRPVNPELGVEVLEAIEDTRADAGDLVLKQRRLVDLDNVRGRAQAVFHHKLQLERGVNSYHCHMSQVEALTQTVCSLR